MVGHWNNFTVYKVLIKSCLDYGWALFSSSFIPKNIEITQNKTLRVFTEAMLLKRFRCKKIKSVSTNQKATHFKIHEDLENVTIVYWQHKSSSFSNWTINNYYKKMFFVVIPECDCYLKYDEALFRHIIDKKFFKRHIIYKDVFKFYSELRWNIQ